jgi:hypothetical protein
MGEWSAGRAVENVHPSGFFKTRAAPIAVLCGVDEGSLPKHGEAHIIRIECEICLLGIADANRARAGALDEVAIDYRFVVAYDLALPCMRPSGRSPNSPRGEIRPLARRFASVHRRQG